MSGQASHYKQGGKMEIDRKQLRELEMAKEKLEALEAGGVDNWEFYDVSLEQYWANNKLGLNPFINQVYSICYHLFPKNYSTLLHHFHGPS